MAWARTTGRQRSRIPIEAPGDRHEGAEHGNVVAPDARALDALATLQTQLLSRVGHSLRSPLNAVIGFSELMRAEIHGPIDPRYREYADHISASGHELLRTAEDALAMAAVALAPEQTEREPLELRPIVIDACRMALPPPPLGAAWRDRFDLALDDDMLIVGDRRAVRQAFCNLMAIGFEIAGPHGLVGITALVKGDIVIVEIVTRGTRGTREESPPRLDAPSFRTDTPGVPSNIGPARLDLALALAIAESLLDVQGGRLEARAGIERWSVRVTLPAPVEALQLSLPID